MTMVEPQFFWVFPQDGDPLPFSGLHRVKVWVGCPSTTVIDPHDGSNIRVRTEDWKRLPHIKAEEGQSLAAIVGALRPFTATDL